MMLSDVKWLVTWHYQMKVDLISWVHSLQPVECHLLTLEWLQSAFEYCYRYVSALYYLFMVFCWHKLPVADLANPFCADWHDKGLGLSISISGNHVSRWGVVGYATMINKCGTLNLTQSMIGRGKCPGVIVRCEMSGFPCRISRYI